MSSSSEETPVSGISSIALERDSSGFTRIKVKIYSKSNLKKDIDIARKWAEKEYDELKIKYKRRGFSWMMVQLI